MVKEVDVVAENFCPGVMDSLGLGWEKLSKINTKLIYAASTGFGNDGPSYKEPGQDLLIQAISGLATINGSESTGPRPVGVSVVDHHGAALYAMAILTGLVNRSVTGKGLRVDVDLLSAAIDLQAESLFYYLNGEKKDSLLSKDNVAGWHNVSPYGLYSTKNGHIVVSLASLEVLTEALEMDINFLENSDAKTNINNENIGSKLQSRFNELSTENACSRLKNKKIWHAKVADYEELIENPQVKHNGILLKTKSAANNAFTAILNPIRIDGKRPGVRIPPQPLGAQNMKK